MDFLLFAQQVRIHALLTRKHTPDGTRSRRKIRFNFSIFPKRLMPTYIIRKLSTSPQFDPEYGGRKFLRNIGNTAHCYMVERERQFTHNVTSRRVRASTVAVEKQYNTTWACICSPSYPACNAHAIYCHLWPAPPYTIFPRYLTNS
jgi:hypothetical protein